MGAKDSESLGSSTKDSHTSGSTEDSTSRVYCFNVFLFYMEFYQFKIVTEITRVAFPRCARKYQDYQQPLLG